MQLHAGHTTVITMLTTFKYLHMHAPGGKDINQDLSMEHNYIR